MVAEGGSKSINWYRKQMLRQINCAAKPSTGIWCGKEVRRNQVLTGCPSRIAELRLLPAKLSLMLVGVGCKLCE